MAMIRADRMKRDPVVIQAMEALTVTTARQSLDITIQRENHYGPSNRYYRAVAVAKDAKGQPVFLTSVGSHSRWSVLSSIAEELRVQKLGALRKAVDALPRDIREH